MPAHPPTWTAWAPSLVSVMKRGGGQSACVCSAEAASVRAKIAPRCPSAAADRPVSWGSGAFGAAVSAQHVCLLARARGHGDLTTPAT